MGISLLFIVTVIIFIAVNTELFTIVKNGDIESIHAGLKGSVPYLLFISLLAMIIQNAFTLIPLILLITLNTTLFGFFNGFIWSWFTSIIAAIVVFYTVRYLLQDWVMRKINKSILAKADQVGLMYVLQARMFPFVPTSAINIIAGISTIHFKPFIIGTMIGNFIYFFVLSLIPLGFLSFNGDKYILSVIVILSILLFYIYKRLSKRAKRLRGA